MSEYYRKGSKLVEIKYSSANNGWYCIGLTLGLYKSKNIIVKQLKMLGYKKAK